MGNFLGFVLFIGAFAAMLGAFTWLGSRIRRRGIGGGLMGPIDEMYNPRAHRYRLEIQIQERQVVPVPSPDDQRRRLHSAIAQPGARRSDAG